MSGTPSGDVEIKALLMGVALQHRSVDACALHNSQELSTHIEAISDLIGRVYGETPSAQHAASAVLSISQLPDGFHEIACKRATLLLALHKEAAVKDHFTSSGADVFVDDLATRVLPFTTPRFLQHGAQSPAQYVLLNIILAEMWAGEKLGTFASTLPTTNEPLCC